MVFTQGLAEKAHFSIEAISVFYFSMADSKNIVILGASYGGLSTTHYLMKHVVLGQLSESKPSHKVVLVSPSSEAICRPACPRAMISDAMFSQEKLFVDIETQLQQYSGDHFRFIQGRATELDHRSRTVSLARNDGAIETISFHSVVIATGASTPSPLMGLNKDEKFLHDCWRAFREAVPTAKSIVIVGGGPAGVETAGELGEHLNGSGRAGLFSSRVPGPDPKVNITVVTSNGKILPALRPSIASRAEHLLQRVGVTVIKEALVKSVEPEGAGTDPALLTSKARVLLEDGRSLTADLYIPATGLIPNTSFLTGTSLLSADGRVHTNPSTLRVDRAGPSARVYAVGDASTFARPAVHNILAAIPVLCANIERDLLLAAEHPGAEIRQDRVFQEDKRETQMVPIGRSRGVGAAMGYRLPSFLVWLIKGRDYWLWTTGGIWSGRQWAKEL